MQKRDSIEQFGIEAFYSDILDNMIADKLHQDQKTNWLLGVAAIIMGLTIPYVNEGFSIDNIGIFVIFGSSLISFLISLIIFDIPKFFRRIPHSNKSLMYYRSYKDMSPEAYAEELRKIRSMDQISDQYAYNICNIVNRNNNLKRNLLKIPLNLLFWGILIGFVLIVFY